MATSDIARRKIFSPVNQWFAFVVANVLWAGTFIGFLAWDATHATKGDCIGDGIILAIATAAAGIAIMRTKEAVDAE